MRKLDFGCGSGGYPGGDAVHPLKRGSWLASNGDTNTVAMDINLDAVREARRRTNPDISFCLSDGRYLPFVDESFDYVREWGVLHHIRKWETALTEIARVMKRGATLVACETVDNDPLYAGCRTLVGSWKGSPIESRFKSGEFLEGLEKRFHIEVVEYWHRPLLIDIPSYFLESYPGLVPSLYYQYYASKIYAKLGILPKLARHVTVKAIRK